MYEESKDCLSELLSYLEIFLEHFVPEPYPSFSINIPIHILDFNPIVKAYCPVISLKQLHHESEKNIEEMTITQFNYDALLTHLKPLFESEKAFYIQISEILQKLMGSKVLNDTE